MNRKLKQLFAVPTLIAVFLTTTASGFRPIFHPPTFGILDALRNDQQDFLAIAVDGELPVRTETAFGLQTTTFDTLEGTVTVNLPDDLAAGDTISGTVIAEAKKQAAPGDVNKKENPADQPVGMDELSGYVVEVAKQPTPSQTHDKDLTNPCNGPEQNQNGQSRVCRKWSIPEGVSRIPLVLKNRAGEIVSRTEVPVAPKGNVARAADDFSTPPLGQAGKPLSVKGPFDGDFANTTVKLANHAAKFLASSPRKVVVESPRDLNGLTEIQIEYKGNTVAKCTYRSISVKLAADKLNLIKGEQTTLSVSLSGLIGLLSPLSVQLTNKSPQTVSMGGGETQIINVNPAELNGDTFSTKRTLTGVQPGGFSISAVVGPIKSEQPNCNSGTARVPDEIKPTPTPGPRKPLAENNKRVEAPRSSITVTNADIQGLSNKLADLNNQLSTQELEAMNLLLCRATRSPTDHPGGVNVKSSFFTFDSRSNNPASQGGIVVEGGRNAIVVQGGRDAIVVQGGRTVRPPSASSAGTAGPTPDMLNSLSAAVGDPQQPFSETIKALTIKLRDFGAHLSLQERGIMDWLLQRAGTKEVREAATDPNKPQGLSERCSGPSLGEALGTGSKHLDPRSETHWMLFMLPSASLGHSRLDNIELCGTDVYPDLTIKSAEVKKSDDIIVTVANIGICDAGANKLDISIVRTKDSPCSPAATSLDVPALKSGESKLFKLWRRSIYGDFSKGCLSVRFYVDYYAGIKEEDEYNNEFILKP
jgi:hypothetical protein